MRRAGDLLKGTAGDNKGGRCGGLGCTVHLDPREKGDGNMRRLGEVRMSVLLYPRGLCTAPGLLRTNFTHGKTPTLGKAHTGRSPHSVLRSWLSRPGFSVRDCVDSKVHSSIFPELVIPMEGAI